MTKLDAALLKLEGALDQTVDPRVRTLIDIAQQAIEEAKQVMVRRPHMQDCDGIACLKAINKRPNSSPAQLPGTLPSVLLTHLWQCPPVVLPSASGPHDAHEQIPDNHDVDTKRHKLQSGHFV